MQDAQVQFSASPSWVNLDKPLEMIFAEKGCKSRVGNPWHASEQMVGKGPGLHCYNKDQGPSWLPPSSPKSRLQLFLASCSKILLTQSKSRCRCLNSSCIQGWFTETLHSPLRHTRAVRHLSFLVKSWGLAFQQLGMSSDSTSLPELTL